MSEPTKAFAYSQTFWYVDCPKCQECNCVDIVPAELSAEEQIEVYDEFGYEEPPDAWHTLEPYVTCCKCGATIEVLEEDEQ